MEFLILRAVTTGEGIGETRRFLGLRQAPTARADQLFLRRELILIRFIHPTSRPLELSGSGGR
jgi:hypothetical protein